LIEQHDTIRVGIEEASLPRCAARTWSAMKKERRFAVGISANFPVDAMTITRFE
jgi:hypothetical protein